MKQYLAQGSPVVIGMMVADLALAVLDPRIREIAILTAAREADSQFEWVQHEAIALREGVAPDIIAVAKGISSAYQPIAATVVKNSVFDSFYGAGALVFGGGHVVLPLLNEAEIGRAHV